MFAVVLIFLLRNKLNPLQMYMYTCLHKPTHIYRSAHTHTYTHTNTNTNTNTQTNRRPNLLHKLLRKCAKKPCLFGKRLFLLYSTDLFMKTFNRNVSKCLWGLKQLCLNSSLMEN